MLRRCFAPNGYVTQGTDCDDADPLVSNACEIGTSPNLPGRDCKAILDAGSAPESGAYWIDPVQSGEPVRVWCDMDTEGGGWTLAWSYRFSDYDDFTDAGNRVTPIPSWPAEDAVTEVSQSAPSTLQGSGAIDFALWEPLGPDFLFTSNLIDHVSCSPGTGDLTTFTAGSISCSNVFDVAPHCPGAAPWNFGFDDSGPWLSGIWGAYVYWDRGDDPSTFPVHDTCMLNASWSHVTGLPDPRGHVFLRR